MSEMLTEDEIAIERRRILAYVTIRYSDEVTVEAQTVTAAGGVNQQLELNGTQVCLFFGSSIIAVHVGEELLEEAKGACVRLSGRHWLVCGKDLAGQRVLPFVVKVDAHGLAYVMAKHTLDVGRVEALLRMSLVLAMGW